VRDEFLCVIGVCTETIGEVLFPDVDGLRPTAALVANHSTMSLEYFGDDVEDRFFAVTTMYHEQERAVAEGFVVEFCS